MLFTSQAEQNGEFWLINVLLTTDKPLSFGHSLTIKNGDNNNEWVLFNQTGKNASFLAKKKYLDEKSIKTQKSPPPPPIMVLSEQGKYLKKGKTYLVLASDLKMAGAFHLLKEQKDKHHFIVIFHAREAFPFIVKPSQIMFHKFPHEAIGSCPLLEDWKQVSRLCSSQGLAGCFDGDFKELFKTWTPPTDWEILNFG